jgi:hypothetical protein
MHFLGYDAETKCGLLVPGAPAVDAYCGDAATKLSHELQLGRDVMVQSGQWKSNEAGTLGISPVIQELPYTRYDRTFVCSVAHGFLYGLVKDFWGLLLKKGVKGKARPWYSLPSAVRTLMTDRASQLVSTIDQDRVYRDIVHKRGTWVMLDYLNWCAIWSVYIMMGREGEVNYLGFNFPSTR